MMIGRTDEWQNPLIPMVITCRAVVWMSLAEPIWASGYATASTGRTHDRIRTNLKFRKTYLNSTGRPHMELGATLAGMGSFKARGAGPSRFFRNTAMDRENQGGAK
jgi:hypothetical protein